MSIDLRIDELILRGFGPLDRARLRPALERELARLIAERGLAGSGGAGESAVAARRPPLKERATITKPAEAGCNGGGGRGAIGLNPAVGAAPAVSAAPAQLPPKSAARFSGLRHRSPLVYGLASAGRSPNTYAAVAVLPGASPSQLAAHAAAALYDALAAHPEIRTITDASAPRTPSTQAPLPSRGGAGGEVP